jgi:hypothetical protein
MIRLVPLILLVAVAPASAFYERVGDDASVDLRGLVRLSVWGSDNPDGSPHATDTGGSAVARLVGKADVGPVTAEVNAYALHSRSSATAVAPSVDVERSSAAAWSGRNDGTTFEQVALDRASLRLAVDRFDLTVGRQPVNLATCYYFVPNDFFAPFGAATFYRVYKPGVDAARLEGRLGAFSQMTLVHVLGYEADAVDATGWSDTVDPGRASTVVRLSALVADAVDVAFIGGEVRGERVMGGGAQGDLPFFGMGFRAEGHYRWSDVAADATEVAAQVNKRFDNSLDVKAEFFHHGAGADRVDRYAASSFPARRYAALGIGYEFSPLFAGEGLVLANLVDDSLLWSIYGVYSLADEAEAAIGATFPAGTGSTLTDVGSEYGATPTTITAELRAYF